MLLPEWRRRNERGSAFKVQRFWKEDRVPWAVIILLCGSQSNKLKHDLRATIDDFRFKKVKARERKRETQNGES